MIQKENELFNIIKGQVKLCYGTIIDTSIKIKYVKLNPYYYCIIKGIENRTENKDIAIELKNKRHRIYYCENNYTYELYWENIDNKGKIFYWRDWEHKIIITDTIRDIIKNDLEILNSEGILLKKIA
jgi:hypothetical protein